MAVNPQSDILVSQELVSVVTDTVSALARAHGYQTYPKEESVRLVLQALKLVKTAVDVKQSMEVRNDHR